MAQEIALEQHDEVQLKQEVQASNNVLTAGTRLEEKVIDIRQFVTFTVGEFVFAVDIMKVQEIIRLPDIFKVPLAPISLKGLSNLRGKVLPIISLRRLFGFAEIESTDASRVLVIDVDQLLGFVVDRVGNMLRVESNQMKVVDIISATIDSDFLTGLIKGVDGHSTIMVLDFHKLVKKVFVRGLAVITKRAVQSDSLIDRQDEDVINYSVSDEVQLISFSVANQEYAVSIDNVQEVALLPDTITYIPQSPLHVIGSITLRNQFLSLVSLRDIFGLSDKVLDDKSRIIVLTLSGSAIAIGIVVDRVGELLHIAQTLVDPTPGLLFKGSEMADTAQIFRLDDGKRLISIIETSKLFNHPKIKSALNFKIKCDEKFTQKNSEAENYHGDDTQVIIFNLDDLEFGIPIHSVQEIIRLPDHLSQVPTAPTFVEGVMNLRGNAIAVIDLRMRLGLPKTTRSDEQRIIVFLTANSYSGFIVDQITELLKISNLAIDTSLSLPSLQGKLLVRTVNIDKQNRMVQLLDLSYLVDDDELKKIASISV